MQRKILYAILLVSLTFTVIISLLNYNEHIDNSRNELIYRMNILTNLSTSTEEISALLTAAVEGNISENLFLYEDNNLIYTNSNSNDEKILINDLIKDFQISSNIPIENYINSNNTNNLYYIIRVLPNNNYIVGTFKYDSMFRETLKIVPLAILPTILGLILIPNIKRSLYKDFEDNMTHISSNLKDFINYGFYDIDVDPEFEGFIRTLKEETEETREYIYKLQSHNNALDKLSKHMKEGFIVLDENNRIISVNNSAIKLLNSSMLVSYLDKDINYLCRNNTLKEAIHECIETKDNVIQELDLYLKHLRLHVNPITNKNNLLLGLIILIVDETDNYELEKVRREFTSNVSHELKTPLTSITGYAELIHSGLIPLEDNIKFSKIIINESRRLIELIESIISISRLEEKGFISDISEINLFELASKVQNSLSLALKEKDISINISSDPNINICANLLMIEELFYNLIDNAINYNVPKGSINVEISINSEGNILFSVADTGIGISYDDQDKIFQRFYMADKSRSYNKKSTGLGLSIVKHIVENLGGNISIESQINLGSKFIVELPKELRN